MNQAAKTIQIYLPFGDPQGIRIAELTTRILQVIEVPRNLLASFYELPESDQVALYFLVGDDDYENPAVYIGQTGDLVSRLKHHNAEKDFWQRALVVISKTQNLTQTHTLYLENYCILACREAGRFTDENGNSGSKPFAPPPLEADCLEIFETARTLLSTLGCPVFEPLAKPVKGGDSADGAESDLYFCNGSEADGKARYTSDGLVVMKGSSGRVETVSSFAKHAYAGLRDELIESGVCRVEDNRFVFIKDHAFKRPSKASVALQGRAGNGWTEWKDAKGRTLDELVRKSDETQS